MILSKKRPPNLWQRMLQFASPKRFSLMAQRLAPWCLVLAIVLGLIGLYWGWVKAPIDGVQGPVYRILYVHVPSSWLAMFLYLMMVGWSLVYLVLKTKLSAWMVQAIAPTGALLCLVSLVSGALWGQPTWGTFWVWDARLTSMLCLLFLYLGFMALIQSLPLGPRAYVAGSLLVIVGGVNLPIIHYSVMWWQTLHQGASLSFLEGSRMAPSMMWPLLLMTLALWFYAWGVILWRCRLIVAEGAWSQHQAWRMLTEIKGVSDDEHDA
ncbi:MAG: cytochrome c biogenesis protein CcsA [Neisseriaceae bacterium]|nr:cytochrome c biogenesis protein CcsA [Neisseriaceae bacterium]